MTREGAITTAYYGSADVRTAEPVTAETRFSVGSLTKPMVATVIVRLAEEGRLALDDPVSAHVPELRGEAWAGRASVRDLLANRSGLPLSAALEFGFAKHADTDDGALSRLAAELAGEVPAGAFWSYSNLGWCLLGRVIETATGSTWEDAMRLHLFDTVAMNSTTFANELEPARRAIGHDITPGGPVAVEPLNARAYGPAGTSVVSTVTDLRGSPPCTWRMHPLPSFEPCTPRSRSTAGSMPGVWDGPGSIGRAGRSGAGMVS
jgi:CubicO group peptidase (beta-lactamase class C family)